MPRPRKKQKAAENPVGGELPIRKSTCYTRGEVGESARNYLMHSGAGDQR